MSIKTRWLIWKKLIWVSTQLTKRKMVMGSKVNEVLILITNSLHSSLLIRSYGNRDFSHIFLQLLNYFQTKFSIKWSKQFWVYSCNVTTVICIYKCQTVKMSKKKFNFFKFFKTVTDQYATAIFVLLFFVLYC